MATSQVETVSTSADKAKLGAAIALVLGSLVGFYLLAKQGQVAQWGILIAGLVAAVAVFMLSEPASSSWLSGAIPGVKSKKLSGRPVVRPSR